MIQKIHAFILTIKNTKQEALKRTPAKGGQMKEKNEEVSPQ